jgi:hypothetical protein
VWYQILDLEGEEEEEDNDADEKGGKKNKFLCYSFPCI